LTSTKSGNITCMSMTFTEEVTTNTLATVDLRGRGSTASGCAFAGGAVLTITNLTMSALQSTGGGTGTANISFAGDLPSGGTCNYSAASAPFTYNPSETLEGGNTLSLSEVLLSVTPAACGTTTKLDGKFKLETDATTVPVYLM
jgi:hypothetical protein